MSAVSFAERWPENQRGKFYVDAQCLDCDLCRETAPKNFARYDDGGYSYISKQPETKEEEELLRESLEGCPCEAIFDDGDEHDWDAVPANAYVSGSPRDPNKKCGHCNVPATKGRRWWEFWK
ncbi:MAG: ferredoxin [Verrucomicrobiae bacterium]|nr:ferredoxin [Verrucomicrobiae bacterium]